MAQTKKRRRRKHRGTQGGSIDTSRRARPRSRAEAKAQARSQMSKSKKKGGSRAPAQRPVRVPSWRGAANRAAVGAVIFLGLLLLLFKQPPGTSIALAALMFAVYIPMGHAIDSFFYNRRLRSEQRARQANGRS
jgi:hypothetical protein